MTCNAGYWRVIADNSPPGELPSAVFFISFFFLTVGLISLVMLTLTVGGALRSVLALALTVAAAAGYFTATYGVLFDSDMLVNIIETNQAEAFDLISVSLIAVTLLLGLVPAILLWRYPLKTRRLPVALLHRSIAILFALSLIVGPAYASQKEVFSVARNHRELQHMIAPLNVISAGYSFARHSLERPAEFKHIALDASRLSGTSEKRRPLVNVLIVGETARAANFSLNGYARNTNVKLAQREGIHFLEAISCGTATAVSLPCMFSLHGRSSFDRKDSYNEENLLDIAARVGYDVVWIDNGNGCKGVCARIPNRDVHFSRTSLTCPNGECYDKILVEELEHILSSVTNDTFIVLHQLGSHGPAYFRRYPDTARVFQPDCRSSSFGDCNRQEITSSYDNTILYTDRVIAAAIDALAVHSNNIDASLIYISDHGESLGEHNLYLHGMPYKFAPEEQTRVPLVAWLSKDTMKQQRIDSNCKPNAVSSLPSHDNLFHTELGLLGIKTAAYNSELDIFSSCRPNRQQQNSVALLPD